MPNNKKSSTNEAVKEKETVEQEVIKFNFRIGRMDIVQKLFKARNLTYFLYTFRIIFGIHALFVVAEHEIYFFYAVAFGRIYKIFYIINFKVILRNFRGYNMMTISSIKTLLSHFINFPFSFMYILSILLLPNVPF